MSRKGQHNPQGKDPLPERRGVNRIVGINADGRPVNNVTAKNRYDVDPKHPWIPVNLFSEDKSHLLAKVFMPNTRERPDVLLYGGKVYEVITTNRTPAEYRLVMALEAVATPPTEDKPK